MLNRKPIKRLILPFMCVAICICDLWKTDAMLSLTIASGPSWGAESRLKLTEKAKDCFSIIQSATNCEYALAALDDAVIRVKQVKDTYLIIIARLGSREKSLKLNRIRLSLIESTYLNRFSDLKYITAEGNRTKGLGQIELYVGGQLLYTLPIQKNGRSFCPSKSVNHVL